MPLEGYTLNDSYSGSGVSTLTTTETTTALFDPGRHDHARLQRHDHRRQLDRQPLRDGSDSTNSTGSGTNTHTFVFSGSATGSSTYTTTYSSLDSGADTSTETVSDAESIGTNGTISSGQNLDTLTSFGTSTETYAENGDQTVTWGPGDVNTGTYSDTETTFRIELAVRLHVDEHRRQRHHRRRHRHVVDDPDHQRQPIRSTSPAPRPTPTPREALPSAAPSPSRA